MEKDSNTFNLMVDLDSILDTRLSLLYSIDKELAASVVETEEYFKRFKDEFRHITLDMFYALYRDRSKRVLLYATPTNIIRIMSDYYINTITNNRILDIDSKIIFYINTYPYVLNSVEQENMTNALTSAIGGGVDIKLVNMSNTELTPVWVDKNIALMIKYDGLSWIENHMGSLNLINNPITDVSLMVPAIILGNHKLDDAKVKDTLSILDNFEKSTETIVKLKFLPITNFSTTIT